MNVSLWIYPAVACISPPIGSSQADPKPTLTKGEVEGVELGGAPISVCVCSMTASRRFRPFARP
jgi:hypothetical protein